MCLTALSSIHQSSSGIGSDLMATRSSNLLAEPDAASPAHRPNTVIDSPYLMPTASSPQLHGMTIREYVAPRLSGALDLTGTSSKPTNQCLNLTDRCMLETSSAEAEDSNEGADWSATHNQQLRSEHKAAQPAVAKSLAPLDPAVQESAFLAAGLYAARSEGAQELRAFQRAVSPSQRAANKLQKLREWLESLDTIRDKLTKYRAPIGCVSCLVNSSIVC